MRQQWRQRQQQPEQQQQKAFTIRYKNKLRDKQTNYGLAAHRVYPIKMDLHTYMQAQAQAHRHHIQIYAVFFIQQCAHVNACHLYHRSFPNSTLAHYLSRFLAVFPFFLSLSHFVSFVYSTEQYHSQNKSSEREN